MIIDPSFGADAPRPSGAARRPGGWIGARGILTDGSIWAGQTRSMEDPSATPAFGLHRYRDGRWDRVLADSLERPDTRGVEGIAVTPNGDMWVAWQGSVDADGNWGDGVVTRYDGRSWTLGEADGLPVDGTVWAVTGEGLARFDGTRWTVVARGAFGPISVAPDGPVFVVGPSGLARVASPSP